MQYTVLYTTIDELESARSDTTHNISRRFWVSPTKKKCIEEEVGGIKREGAPVQRVEEVEKVK